MMIEENPFVKEIIQLALKEDIGPGDVTTDSIIRDNNIMGCARLMAKEDLILAGLSVFKQVFLELWPDMEFESFFKDGDLVRDKEIICLIKGPVNIILKGERTALNFLQRMSGIATMTKRFVERISSANTRILDTRKTVPGWRILDKYAVRIGGGHNHRFGLFDGVLIKDNHISAAGSVGEAIKLVKVNIPHTLKIEVEVETLDELKEAINSGADAVLLDNMDMNMLRKAVEIAKDRVIIEVSGGITLEDVGEIAKTGVDFISVGAITHSVKGVDISLELQRKGH